MSKRKHRYGVLYTDVWSECVRLDDSFEESLREFAYRSLTMNRECRVITLRTFKHKADAQTFCMDRFFKTFVIV